MFRFFTLYFLILISFSTSAQAQQTGRKWDADRNKGKALLFSIGAGVHLPAGDLAKRFKGPSGSVGISLEFLNVRNILVGAEGAFFFGDKVKEDPLTILRLSNGEIIGNDLSYANFNLQERGFYYGVRTGKLFARKGRRSGWKATLGAGYMTHKIRLQDNGRTLTQVTGEYAKGYDRLTGGFALQQYFGWQHLGLNRRTNWAIGMECTQAFTNTLRSWDYSSGGPLDKRRLDVRVGLRAVWTLPFYLKKAEEIFY